MATTKIGIIGCGNICGIYFKNLGEVFENVSVKACADLLMDRSRAKAEEFAGVKAMTVKELLADPEIAIVVNLTTPDAHYEVAMQAIKAGKSVHNEKPLALTRAQGKKMLAAAKARGVRVGCAPDTFMGAGGQTCRKLIDDGWIGTPIAASVFMMCHGHESWHPDPDFYYQPGGGPMFDMGPYYLTALTNLLGPTASVAGSATTTFPERLITSQPHYGEIINVKVPTHVNGIMQFASGAMGTITTSFDVWRSAHGPIEIYGTEGSLRVPDPNGFGVSIRVKRAEHEDWTEVPHTHGYADRNRGIGVADMAYAIRSGRPHRASGAMAYHVLDIMHAFTDAWESRQWVKLESTVERPAALPVGLRPGTLDE